MSPGAGQPSLCSILKRLQAVWSFVQECLQTSSKTGMEA